MRILFTIVVIILTIPLNASVHIFAINPTFMEYQASLYIEYFSKIYPSISIIKTGSNLDKFQADYQTLINTCKNNDTIIMLWIGHTGRTPGNYRGGACFILSDKTAQDIDQDNELFGFDAINMMADWLTTHYKYRVVMIFETCYSGQIEANFKPNSKITMLLSVGAQQENLVWPNTKTCWFSSILLHNISTIKNSDSLISVVNKNYKNRDIYKKTYNPTRNKQPIEYYPFTAIHLGTPFIFK